MSLGDVISISVSAQTQTPSVSNFGVPLLVGYHTRWANQDRARLYTSLSGMIADGFTTSDHLYKMANAVASQTPRPKSWWIGRRATAYTHTVTLTVLGHVTGDTLSVTIDGVKKTYTILSGDTTATLAAASFVTAMGAVTGLTITSSGAVITFAATDSKLHRFSAWTSNMTFQDITADSGGLAADLTAINAVCSGGWYGLVTDGMSPAQIEAAAAFQEGLGFGLHCPLSCDYDVSTSVTNDVYSTLMQSTYTRTIPFYTANDNFNFWNIGILASRLCTTPGSDTWAFKSSSGTAVDVVAVFSETRQNYVLGKDASIYTQLDVLPCCQFGKNAAGSYADVIRFTDWVVSTMRANILFLLANNNKIPFTNAGITLVDTTLQAVLTTGEKVGGFAKGSTSVTSPQASDVSSVDKGNRTLTGVVCNGTLAGAIHSIALQLNVSL